MSTVTSAAGIPPPSTSLGQTLNRLTDDLPDLLAFGLVFVPVLALLYVMSLVAIFSPWLAMFIGSVPVLYVLGRSVLYIHATRHQQYAVH